MAARRKGMEAIEEAPITNHSPLAVGSLMDHSVSKFPQTENVLKVAVARFKERRQTNPMLEMIAILSFIFLVPVIKKRE